jgi:endoglucanase
MTKPQVSALRASGNKIVNASGQQVILRGVNSFGESFACMSAQTNLDGTWGQWPHTQDTISLMVSWGANCVRVSINPNCWLCQNAPVTCGSTYQNAVLGFVNGLLAAGMWVIVTVLAENPAGSNMADAQTTAFWQDFAPRYANDGRVVYEPINEPHDITWTTWLNGGNNGGSLGFTAVGMQSLVNTIRDAGATNLLLLDGNAYAYDFSGFLANVPTDTQNNFGAALHAYSGNPSHSGLDQILVNVGPIAALYPLVATECGGYVADGGATWLTPFLQYMDSIASGYLPWAWYPGPSISLLSDAFDTAQGIPSSYGLFYRRHLLQAQNTPGSLPASSVGTRKIVVPTLAY